MSTFHLENERVNNIIRVANSQVLQTCTQKESFMSCIINPLSYSLAHSEKLKEGNHGPSFENNAAGNANCKACI